MADGRISSAVRGALIALLFTALYSPHVHAQSAGTQDISAGQLIRPIRTDSPRETLATLLRLQEEIDATLLSYRTSKSRSDLEHLGLLVRQGTALIDLSRDPSSSRREVGAETVFYLMDIFGRIPPPDLSAFPDASSVSETGDNQRWRVPGTPIQIVHLSEGPREGEFVFSTRTVQAAERFFAGIRDLPLRTRLDFATWTDASRQFAGPMIPASVVDAMPARLRVLWLDTPVWKVLAVIGLSMLAAVLLAIIFRVLGQRMPEHRFHAATARLIKPGLVVAFAHGFDWFFSSQIMLSGQFSSIVAAVAITVEAIGWASLFWLGVIAVFEAVILSPRIPEASIDANLLRLLARCIGIVGVVAILAVGGQELGLPVVSLLAGIGVGGLAVALAIRPTLENLIGGIVLYVDKPVRVGDFCTFGNESGTVEKIGIRSTQLRASNRTLISIPNAQFADMKLINWAQCDKMLIQEVIGVRYETDPDQLRFLLAKIRRMLHAHPRIDKDTVRVRFSGYGDSSLDITIRIYALTREWNDFFAIREDVLLRLYDLVCEAGSDFAFPSQTIYMHRDSGINEQAADKAKASVERWRRHNDLPFPRLRQDDIEKLEGTLDYPPKGSPEFLGERLDEITSEGLSSDEPAEEDDTEPATPPDAVEEPAPAKPTAT